MAKLLYLMNVRSHSPGLALLPPVHWVTLSVTATFSGPLFPSWQRESKSVNISLVRWRAVVRRCNERSLGMSFIIVKCSTPRKDEGATFRGDVPLDASEGRNHGAYIYFCIPRAGLAHGTQ